MLYLRLTLLTPKRSCRGQNPVESVRSCVVRREPTACWDAAAASRWSESELFYRQCVLKRRVGHCSITAFPQSDAIILVCEGPESGRLGYRSTKGGNSTSIRAENKRGEWS